MLLKKSLDWFGYHVNFLFRVVPERKLLHWGIGNRCNDGRYVLFLDYDHVPLEWVEEEIKLLQETCFDLGHAYIWRTKHGLHVIFLQKLYLGRVKELLDRTSADKNYKEVPMQYARKIWVLRQSAKTGWKNEYLGVRKSACHVQRSNAHAVYLVMFMGVSKKDFEDGQGPFDKETEVTMGYYHIAERNN